MKKAKQGPAIIWFRNDIRLHDNKALYEAVSYAGQLIITQQDSNYQIQDSETGVIAIYFVTIKDYKNHDLSPAKIDFIIRNLALLKSKLKSELNIDLLVIEKGKDLLIGRYFWDFSEIPLALVELCAAEGSFAVFANKEYEVNEGLRDQAVARELAQNGITFSLFEDQCVVPPDRLSTAAGNPYIVFTPFKNSWIKYLESNKHLMDVLPTPTKCKQLNPASIKKYPDPLYLHDSRLFVPGFEISDSAFLTEIRSSWPAGENEAIKRLEEFIKNKGDQYKEQRDFPAIHGTSRLSTYFALGVISIRLCLEAAKKANKNQLATGSAGLVHWISELVWREFYRSILFNFPRVCKYQPFQLATKKIPWNSNEAQFEAWKEGRTGYPIVDAGMRQLKATGWLHNRLRMVVAMFLTKQLLIDWRKGEKYFMQTLIDGDFASNNGGWQWSASTGTDSQPYFRIFNPYLQSAKFDADGSFIKHWVPELRSIKTPAAVHNPYKELPPKEFEKLGYPKPIVDHAASRVKVIETFKRVLNKDYANEGKYLVK